MHPGPAPAPVTVSPAQRGYRAGPGAGARPAGAGHPGSGQRNEPLARQASCTPNTVRKWRSRWAAAATHLAAADADGPALERAIAAALADGPALRHPGDLHRRADRADHQSRLLLPGAVPAPRRRLDARRTGRRGDPAGHRGYQFTALGRAFLKGEADLQPRRSRYWLNAKAKQADPETSAAQAEAICTAYAYGPPCR